MLSKAERKHWISGHLGLYGRHSSANTDAIAREIAAWPEETSTEVESLRVAHRLLRAENVRLRRAASYQGKTSVTQHGAQAIDETPPDPKRMTAEEQAVWELHEELLCRPDGLGAAYEKWRQRLQEGLAKIERARMPRRPTEET